MEKEQNLLSYWNTQGIFIRQNENENDYRLRTHKIPIDPTISSEASLLDIYDFTPQWIEVSYSDKGIYFFEAGCSWIEDGDEPGHIHIQLKRHFQDHERLFGLYTKEEVLTHEYVHAARFLFSDSKYDEYFCYYLSKRHGLLGSIRTFLGPLFQSPYEIGIVLLLIAFPLLTLLCYPTLAIFSLSIPIAFLSTMLLRLLLRWRRWSSCKKNLSKLLSKPLFLMLRLTDEELELFADYSPSKIKQWIAQQTSFRWKSLLTLYPLADYNSHI